MKEIIHGISIQDTLTGLVAIVTILGAGWKAANYFYKKIMGAILENRVHNEKITNEFKEQLMAHANEDKGKFDSMENKFDKLFDLSGRTDEKVTLLINNKIK